MSRPTITNKLFELQGNNLRVKKSPQAISQQADATQSNQFIQQLMRAIQMIESPQQLLPEDLNANRLGPQNFG